MHMTLLPEHKKQIEGHGQSFYAFFSLHFNLSLMQPPGTNVNVPLFPHEHLKTRIDVPLFMLPVCVDLSTNISGMVIFLYMYKSGIHL